MIHPIDALGGAIVSHGPDRLRFFTDGWGDMSIINRAVLPTDVPQPISIEWVSDVTNEGLTTSVGVFESPAEILPSHARHGAVTRITPEAGANRMVVLMARLSGPIRHRSAPRQTRNRQPRSGEPVLRHPQARRP